MCTSAVSALVGGGADSPMLGPWRTEAHMKISLWPYCVRNSKSRYDLASTLVDRLCQPAAYLSFGARSASPAPRYTVASLTSQGRCP